MTTQQTKQPFENCASNGKRKQLTERFTAYLNTRDTEKHAFVANLNGSWGTGKTYFVEEWQKLLKEQGYIAIKIDAWESDYLEDSLSILVAELLEQIYEQDSRDDFTEAEKKLTRGIISLGKAIAPSIIKGALATWVWGEETNKELKAIFDNAAESLNDINTGNAKTPLGSFADEAFGKHKLHKSFSKQFKTEIRNLFEAVNNSKNEPKEKTYIFVDELDRCRPTYAIEMLETVKHLFDIPNVIFVLSTDTEQLEHSIKAVYGQDFNSREYLSRFFNQRMVLPEPDLLDFIKAEQAFESLDFSNLKSFPQINQADQLQDAFCIFCELNKHNLNLRKIKHLVAITEGLLIDPEVLRYQFPIYLFLAAIFGDTLYYGTKIKEGDSPITGTDACTYSYKSGAFSNNKHALDSLLPAAENQKIAVFIEKTISDFSRFELNQKNIGNINQWPIFNQSKNKINPLINKVFIDVESCHQECLSIEDRRNAEIKSVSTHKEMINLIRRTSTSFEES
jgi:hypothetical protein